MRKGEGECVGRGVGREGEECVVCEERSGEREEGGSEGEERGRRGRERGRKSV